MSVLRCAVICLVTAHMLCEGTCVGEYKATPVVSQAAASVSRVSVFMHEGRIVLQESSDGNVKVQGRIWGNAKAVVDSMAQTALTVDTSEITWLMCHGQGKGTCNLLDMTCEDGEILASGSSLSPCVLVIISMAAFLIAYNSISFAVLFAGASFLLSLLVLIPCAMAVESNCVEGEVTISIPPHWPGAIEVVTVAATSDIVGNFAIGSLSFRSVSGSCAIGQKSSIQVAGNLTVVVDGGFFFASNVVLSEESFLTLGTVSGLISLSHLTMPINSNSVVSCKACNGRIDIAELNQYGPIGFYIRLFSSIQLSRGDSVKTETKTSSVRELLYVSATNSTHSERGWKHRKKYHCIAFTGHDHQHSCIGPMPPIRVMVGQRGKKCPTLFGSCNANVAFADHNGSNPTVSSKAQGPQTTQNQEVYVVTSTIRACDQLRALVLALNGISHIIGRMVWDLVRDTATTFVLDVQGRRRAKCDAIGRGEEPTENEDQEQEEKEEHVFLCVRVSRLLGSVVGDIEERGAAGVPGPYWVSDRLFVALQWEFDGGSTDPSGRWYMWDSVAGEILGIVDEDPATFSEELHVANGKWLVRAGRTPAAVVRYYGDPPPSVMLTVRLNLQGPVEAGLCRFCCEGGATCVELPQFLMQMEFVPSRPDELLLVVCVGRETSPRLLIVDVPGTHVGGTLKVLSVTRCLITLIEDLTLFSVFTMKRHDGSLCFVTQMEDHCFEVERSTGVVRNIACGSYCPLSDSEYVPSFPRDDGNVPVWDCNNEGDTANEPARLIKMPATRKGEPGDWVPTVVGALGFLFHTDPVGSRITVIEATTPQEVPGFLVISFPLWTFLTLSLVFYD
ncbi:hypothetical protein Pelo_712 [Pelomyxa schiedti]|nr:hypothetical protein Pelo_712 [Pelomyxa schiedti]